MDSVMNSGHSVPFFSLEAGVHPDVVYAATNERSFRLFCTACEIPKEEQDKHLLRYLQICAESVPVVLNYDTPLDVWLQGAREAGVCATSFCESVLTSKAPYRFRRFPKGDRQCRARVCFLPEEMTRKDAGEWVRNQGMAPATIKDALQVRMQAPATPAFCVLEDFVLDVKGDVQYAFSCSKGRFVLGRQSDVLEAETPVLGYFPSPRHPNVSVVSGLSRNFLSSTQKPTWTSPNVVPLPTSLTIWPVMATVR